MLVLSRKINEKIILPDINATLQIVGVKPGMVRLGFEGPDNVSIFREEIFNQEKWEQDQAQREKDLRKMVRRLMHDVRNRLNASTIGIALLRQQLERGLLDAIPQTLQRIEQEIAQLRKTVDDTSTTTDGRKPRHCKGDLSALLVEDDHNERELLAGYLRLAGVEVATAGDGSDALDYLNNHNQAPNFVLMDLSLPHCDGLTAAREIRKSSRFDNTKIFAVTGMERKEASVNGSSPVDGWFQKPLNPEILLREMQ